MGYQQVLHPPRVADLGQRMHPEEKVPCGVEREERIFFFLQEEEGIQQQGGCIVQSHANKVVLWLTSFDQTCVFLRQSNILNFVK
jgi:hypothetical protein